MCCAGNTLAKYSCNTEAGVTKEEAAQEAASAAALAASLAAGGCKVPGADKKMLKSATSQALSDVLVAGFADSASCQCQSANTVISFTAEATFDEVLPDVEGQLSALTADNAQQTVDDLASRMLSNFEKIATDSRNFADEYCEPVYGVADQSAETCVILSAGNETELSMNAGALLCHMLLCRHLACF